MIKEKPFKNRIKTIFGITKTLCDIVERVSERVLTNDSVTPYYRDYITTHYKMNCYKSVTNYYFLLMTHVNTSNMENYLENLYKKVFIELILKNVMYKSEEIIKMEHFKNAVKDYFYSIYREKLMN